jgi:hypothetical protein
VPDRVSWRDEFIAEFVEFPHGDFTDQVDAATQYLDYMTGKPHLIMLPPRTLAAQSRQLLKASRSVARAAIPVPGVPPRPRAGHAVRTARSWRGIVAFTHPVASEN